MQELALRVNELSAVVYARVSSDQQTLGYSLQTQIEAGRIYAQQHNYRVLGDFSDDYTGENLDRPSLNKLRDFVSELEFVRSKN